MLLTFKHCVGSREKYCSPPKRIGEELVPAVNHRVFIVAAGMNGASPSWLP